MMTPRELRELQQEQLSTISLGRDLLRGEFGELCATALLQARQRRQR